MIEEVENLIRTGVSRNRLRRFGLEYKFITDYLDNIITRHELFEKLNTAIHQYAKRQMTWFRKMEREGYQIRWIDVREPLQTKVRMIVDKCCG